MDKKQNVLETLKGKNPYKVPTDYFKNLSETIMDEIPLENVQVPQAATFYQRVRPWFYLAAVFIGLLVFFRVFLNFTGKSEGETGEQSLYVYATMPEQTFQAISEEDQDYLDYLESEYIYDIIIEEIE